MDSYALSWFFINWPCSSSTSFFRHQLSATRKETYDKSTFFFCDNFKPSFHFVLMTFFTVSIWPLVGVEEGTCLVVQSSALACIEDKQECSAALLCIHLDLVTGCFGSLVDSLAHSALVSIWVATDLVCFEAICFDSFLECVSPIASFWYGALKSTKLRAIFEIVVDVVVKDQADLVVGFEEAAYHSRVVEDLGCTLDSDGLRKWAEEVEWLSHNENFLTTESFLNIGGPSLEDI